MVEIYGDVWDQAEEVRELCLNCKYADCFGNAGCPERQAIVERLKRQGDMQKISDVRYTAKGQEFEINGVKKSLREWAEEYGLKYQTLWQRLKFGYSLKEALNAEVKHGGHRGKKREIEIDGVSQTYSEWMAKMHIAPKTIRRFMEKNKCSKFEALIAICRKKVHVQNDLGNRGRL